jgi:hypothetical protein
MNACQDKLFVPLTGSCLLGESLFPDIVGIPVKSEEEMLSESRVRENFTHGLMRGWRERE